MHDGGPHELNLDAFPILAITILGVVASVGILSNAVILITVWMNHRLRNSTCWYICSLATADVVVLTCVVPFAAIQDLTGHWPYKEEYCDMWIIFDLTFSITSLLSILLLAIDKYLTVRMPFTYTQKMTTKWVLLVLVCTWGLSLCTIVPPVKFGHRHIVSGPIFNNTVLGQINSGGECLAQFEPAYALLLSVLGFVLPCIVMVIVYSRLYLQAKEAAHEIKAVQISLQCNYATAGTAEQSRTSGTIGRLRMEYKAAVTIAVIMGAFLCCWMPFFVVQILSSIDQDCCHALSFKVALWIGYVNSMINPLIYGFMDKKIRSSLKTLLWQASASSMARLSTTARDSKGSRDVTHAESTT